MLAGAQSQAARDILKTVGLQADVLGVRQCR